MKKVMFGNTQLIMECLLVCVQDVADLAVECGAEAELKESKGSVRLGQRVEAMIGNLDQALQRLGNELVTSNNGTLQKMQKER